MVQAINTNISGISRPGVFVNQTSIGGLPQPLASHAIGYIFVSTEADEYQSKKFSILDPYVPTQISSVDDYIRKIGGVPSTNATAAISYESVKAFFDNSGSNGILYATRVTATPEVLIEIPTQAGSKYKLFTLKINGRYYGNFDLEVDDAQGVPMKAILTTGLDALDNSYDIFEYLSEKDADFNLFYEIERTSSNVLNKTFRIYSKSTTSVPKIEDFKAFKLLNANTADTASVIDILATYPESVKPYYPIKNLAIRLQSRYSGREILFISGQDIADYNQELLGQSTIPPEAIADLSAIPDNPTPKEILVANLIRSYITAKDIDVEVGQCIAISIDASGAPADEAWPDEYTGYTDYAGSGALSFGDVPTGDLDNRTGYLPETVQVAYVNIAGENRVLISNGNGPNELTQGFVDAITEVFDEKGISQYYDIEPELLTYASNTQIFPNNGYSLTSYAIGDHGSPTTKPTLNSDDSPLVLSDSSTITVAIVSGAPVSTLTGTFSIAPYPGMVIYRDGTRLKVISVVDDTNVIVEKLGGGATSADATARFAYVDKSEANGFYIYDYVANIKITSKNGTTPPIFTGVNRLEAEDSNVVVLPDSTETLNFDSYKYSIRTKASDYAYALRKSLTSQYYAPGYIFVPEAFATLVSDDDTYTRSLALEDRLKVISAMNVVCAGSINDTNLEQATQFVGLVDCGGDIKSVTEASEELSDIKAVIGSPFGHLAYYAPYITNESGNQVPPSGYVAGIACSRNVTEGFQQPPAGVRYPLRGAIGLKFPITSQQQEITYALGLNAIRSLPNKGIVVWGARTLSSNALFKYINTRVILNVLIDTLSRSFDDILFEQIDSGGSLYSRVVAIATTILNQFYRQGALFGNRPEQAYSIICNDSNNTVELLEQGTVRCDIYVATSPTLERILISVARTPAGQVAIINDSFSRNIDRFQAATRAQTVL
jgi:hypothetical protein